MKHLFILLISLFSLVNVFAQDISGIWTGTSVNVISGKTVIFDDEIIITQKGKKITAKFYSREAGKENYSIVIRKGTFKNGVLRLSSLNK